MAKNDENASVSNEIRFIADGEYVLIKVLVRDPAITSLANAAALRTDLLRQLPFEHRFMEDPALEEAGAFESALMTGEPLVLQYILRYLAPQKQVEQALKWLGFMEIEE